MYSDIVRKSATKLLDGVLISFSCAIYLQDVGGRGSAQLIILCSFKQNFVYYLSLSLSCHSFLQYLQTFYSLFPCEPRYLSSLYVPEMSTVTYQCKYQWADCIVSVVQVRTDSCLDCFFFSRVRTISATKQINFNIFVKQICLNI